jgi:hypothetical protein
MACMKRCCSPDSSRAKIPQTAALTVALKGSEFRHDYGFLIGSPDIEYIHEFTNIQDGLTLDFEINQFTTNSEDVSVVEVVAATDRGICH